MAIQLIYNESDGKIEVDFDRMVMYNNRGARYGTIQTIYIVKNRIFHRYGTPFYLSENLNNELSKAYTEWLWNKSVENAIKD